MSPMTLTLTNVYVSSANVGGAGEERPLLSVTLDAEKVETGTATK